MQPTRDEIIAAEPWWQKVTFPCGITVGRWHTDDMLTALSDGVDFRGKNAIDIGCMAGVGTKFMEDRGASVVAFDITRSSRKQFDIVKRAFGLAATYETMTVYDMADHMLSAEVVLFAGVYYHLRHPLLGLYAAWDAAEEVLLIEGEIIEGNEPTALFVKAEYKGDGTNWWVPTKRCLLDWVDTLRGVWRVVDATPDGWLSNRVLLQVWRHRA